MQIQSEECSWEMIPTELMPNRTPMMNYEGILSEARELLTEGEQRKLALDVAPPQKDPEQEASLARGIADMRAGRVTDFDDFMAELEAEDRPQANGG